LRIKVTVKPHSKTVGLDLSADGSLVVRVREPARENKANEAAIAALAEYYRVPRSRVHLVAGSRSRHKVMEVEGR